MLIRYPRLADNYTNLRTGAGLRSDKARGGFWTFDSLANNKQQLEAMYVGSWSASKIINIPVDDMFIYPRIISGLADQQLTKFDNFCESLNVDQKISQAMKAGRLYGTAFLLMVTNDNVMTAPLNTDASILQLKNLIVIDRFNTQVVEFDRDFTSPNFMKPKYYTFELYEAAPITVHYSRVIRIDSITPLTINSWQSGYNQYWGISEIVRCLGAIQNEENIADVVDYLMQESSVPMLKIEDLKDALAGEQDAFDNTKTTIETFVGKINDLKSNYRTTYLDSDMDMSRLQVNFAGIPDVIDRFNNRLAAVADIPQTRFFGRSPAGFNATGDSDMANYGMMVSAMQQRMLKPIYDKLDILIGKTLGIKQTIEYRFKPLVEASITEQSQADWQNAQRDQIYMANSVLTPEEVKRNLYDNRTYSDITPDIEDSAVFDPDTNEQLMNNMPNQPEQQTKET